MTAAPLTLSQAFDLARQHQTAGRHDDAEGLYRQILAAKPEVASAWQNLGVLKAARGQISDGIACLSRALALQPDLPALRLQQAILMQQTGQGADALPLLRRHVAEHPTDAVGWYNLAVLEAEHTGAEAALPAYHRVLALEPNQSQALYNLAQLHRRLGQTSDAIACLEKLLAIAPDHAEGHFHLASCCRHSGDLTRAIFHYRQTIALRPNFAAALSNLGNLLKDLGDNTDARQCLEQALTIQPDLPEAQFNLAILDLLAGDLAKGWPGMAQRWRSPSFPSPTRHFACPPWPGDDLTGRRLLIWGEQGVGDEIILAQMIGDVAQRTADCIVECDPRLVPLLSRSFPEVSVIPRGDPSALPALPRPVDYHCALVDLGPSLRRDFRLFPNHSGYLRPPDRLTATLQRRYRVSIDGQPVIGLSWSSSNPSFGRQKSVALADLAPILTALPARFVSLQYGADPADVAATAQRLGVDLVCDADIDPLIDLDGFAAQVAAMDLIITTSSTTAHMAGALGKPCWVMVPAGIGLLWYWFLERTDSPWYPSATLFRQPRDGNWAPVVQDIANRLKAGDYSGKRHTDGRA